MRFWEHFWMLQYLGPTATKKPTFFWLRHRRSQCTSDLLRVERSRGITMSIFARAAPGQHLEKLEKLEKVEKNSQGRVRFSQGRIFSRSGREIQRIAWNFPKVYAEYFLKVGTRFLKVETCFPKVDFNFSQGRFGFLKLSITSTRSWNFTPQSSLCF